MKNKKGFTLVEIIVSVALIMVVLFYLLRSIINISSKSSDLVTRQEYSVYENNLLVNFYKDAERLSNTTEIGIPITSENNGVYTIEYTDIKNEKNESVKLVIDSNDNKILYNGIVYKLPENVTISKDKKPYSIDTIKRQGNENDRYGMIVTNIYVKINDKDETIKLMYQGILKELKSYVVNFYTNVDPKKNDAEEIPYKIMNVVAGTDLTSFPDSPTNGEKPFAGWYKNRTSGNQVYTPITINSDLSLYAHWSEEGTRKIKVSYNPNFEQTCSNSICNTLTGSMNDSIFDVSIDNKLNKNSFVKKETYNSIQKVGYKFMGWNTKANGSGTFYKDEDIIKANTVRNDITLYAQWIKDGWDYINIVTNYGDSSYEGLKAQKWKYFEEGVPINSGFRYLDPSYGGYVVNVRKFHFSNGFMDVGWIIEGNKKYFCSWFDKDGNHFIEGYVFNNEDGWELIDGKWYSFNSNGVVLTGWQKLPTDDREMVKENGNKAWYYLSPNTSTLGQIQQGWLELGGKKYYLDTSSNTAGALMTGWVTIDNKKYYFSETGDSPESGLGVLQQ